MTKTKNRVVAVLVSLCLMVSLFATLTLAAPLSAKAAVGDYNAADVAIINALIDNNGLTGFNKDDPDGWDMSAGGGFIQWTGAAPNKRVGGIYIHPSNTATSSVSLSGAVSLAGLAELDDVVMDGHTGITSLVADGCAKLSRLQVGARLIDQPVALASLSISGCTALKDLSVLLTALTALDLSSNTALTRVNFGGSDVTVILPGGKSIVLGGGDKIAAMYIPNDQLSLSYLASTGFTKWYVNPTFPTLHDTTLQDKNCSLDISGGFTTINVSATAEKEPDPEPEPEPVGGDNYQQRHDEFWMPVLAQLSAMGESGTLTVDAPRDLDHVRHYIFDALNGTSRTLVVTWRGETYRISGQNLGSIALGNNHVFYPLLDPYRV